jgi:hypothetical protein
MKKLLVTIGFPAFLLGAQLMNRVELKLDSSEAEAVLTILDRRAEQKPVTDTDWQMLFLTIPYQRLKKRETSMGRDFADAEFKRFVVTLDARRGDLRRTLAAWKKVDLAAAAQRLLRNLPDEAMLHAAVYPAIKPQNKQLRLRGEYGPCDLFVPGLQSLTRAIR